MLRVTSIAEPAHRDELKIASLGPVTAIVRQYAPAQGADGHFVAFDVVNARADIERFLAGVLSGTTPKIGN